MTINANTMISIALGDKMFRNIACTFLKKVEWILH